MYWLFRALLLFLFLSLASFSAQSRQDYDYRVIDKKPQSRDHFVQGLEIVDGYLYLSTGMYGESQLLRYRWEDGSPDAAHKLDARVFAEGLTVVGDQVYQLTWRNRMLLVYDKNTLKPKQWFRIPGEGWGLTNNGRELIYSDGSEHLHFVSTDTGEISRSLTVRDNGRKVKQLNELEWIDGKIWANVWQTNHIVIIDPLTGEVSGKIDLSGLLPTPERRPGTDVLNGIARNPADHTIWVTGKRWPWLYQIELLPKPATSESQPAAQISR